MPFPMKRMEKSSFLKPILELLILQAATVLLLLTIFIIYDHIPVYKEGTCLKSKRDDMSLVGARVEKNYILQGYSDIAVLYEGYKFDTLKVTFVSERNSKDSFTVIDCAEGK